jgi:adenylate kinase
MTGTVFSEEIGVGVAPKRDHKPPVIIFLGPPGAGKGTHAVRLSQTLKIPHISTGDLFREHIRNKTDLGIQAKDFIDLGQLVPDALVLDMLFMRVEQEDCAQGFILDGFPRTVSQGEALHMRLKVTHQVIALHFVIADAHLVERITGRMVCKHCATPYHKKNCPPKNSCLCDFCGGPLYQREDDREEVLRERLKVYQNQTKPLVLFYAQSEYGLKEIAADRSPEEVFEAISQVVPALSLMI